MKTAPLRYVKPQELVGLPTNPRKITKQELNTLMDSLRENGWWPHRPAAVERQPWTDKLVVLDGNQRLKAWRLLKKTAVPVVEYSELTDEERNDIILRGNINNGEWDIDLLQTEQFEGIDFGSIGLHIDLPEQPAIAGLEPEQASHAAGLEPGQDSDAETGDPANEESEEEAWERESFYRRMMGDFIYPTNNIYGVPVLLKDNMPVHLELPMEPWGVESRHKVMRSTYHFYVDDYRFEALFKDPITLLMSGCKMIVEPNVSIHDNTPPAYALWQIYRKRYLSRYLQECGMQIWVDLNVPQRFAEWNLLGVPQGYNAFSTRGVSGWQPTLDIHYEQAKQVSGLDHPNLVVYGGGKDIQEWAMEHELAWHPEFINGKQRNDK